MQVLSQNDHNTNGEEQSANDNALPGVTPDCKSQDISQSTWKWGDTYGAVDSVSINLLKAALSDELLMSDTEDAECANSTISRRRSERHSSRTSTLGFTAEVTIAQSGWVSWMLRRMGLLEKVCLLLLRPQPCSGEIVPLFHRGSTSMGSFLSLFASMGGALAVIGNIKRHR